MIREAEFTFSSNIIIDYPDISTQNSFLDDPVGYIHEKCNNASKENKLVRQVVILTTYGNILLDKLVSCGYVSELINMPAGPDNTYKFSKAVEQDIGNIFNCVLYIEYVNEKDSKILPTFVASFKDESGALCGGMSGSVWTDNHGVKSAYIATVVVDMGSPKGIGGEISQYVMDYLVAQGVYKVNLGTQTASDFYKKQGFTVIHHILSNLRTRMSSSGTSVMNDLVIMEKLLS